MRRLASILALCLLANGVAQATDAANDIVAKLPGWWTHQAQYGPAVGGTLTLDGRQSQWRAAIAGFEVFAARDADTVAFTLPGGRGKFSGRVLTTGGIEGFWMQPPGVTLNSAYATPIALKLVAPKVWIGEVRPLSDRVTLYLKIDRGEDGTLTGFIRNPEFNFGLRRPFRIEVDGEQVSFINTMRAGDELLGRFDSETGHLSMLFQGVSTFEFSRDGVDTLPGVAPGSSTSRSVASGAPLPTGDGWRTATPEDAGMHSDALRTLSDHLHRQLPTDVHKPYPHAILVARRGRLVFEEYFYGFDRDRVHDTRSAGKTLTSILLGVAQKRYGGFDVDTPVLPLFAQYEDVQHHEKRKSRITVKNLLTMTSGLDCDDNSDASPGNEDVMQSQRRQTDWYRYTLDLPMVRDPGGEQAVYCSAGINLLGGIVAQRSGLSLYEFFQRYLAGPLQIDRYYMNLMPGGQGYGAGGIYLRPRDALKLGQLYLDHGRWNGKQIVDSAWVDASTRQHAQFDAGHGYGYAWHLHQISVGERRYRSYAAEGNGGQFIIVVPELELVVMIAAGNYGDFKAWYALQNLVATHIIPAITETEDRRQSR